MLLGALPRRRVLVLGPHRAIVADGCGTFADNDTPRGTGSAPQAPGGGLRASSPRSRAIMASYAASPSVVIAATPVPSGRCTVSAWIVNGPNLSSSRGDSTAPSGSTASSRARAASSSSVSVSAAHGSRCFSSRRSRAGGAQAVATVAPPATSRPSSCDRRDRVEGQGGHGPVGSLRPGPEGLVLDRPTADELVLQALEGPAVRQACLEGVDGRVDVGGAVATELVEEAHPPTVPRP